MPFTKGEGLRLRDLIALQMPKEEQLKIGDHYKFTPEELPYWDAYSSVGVSGKAGSLFLWDSRAVHAVRVGLAELFCIS